MASVSFRASPSWAFPTGASSGVPRTRIDPPWFWAGSCSAATRTISGLGVVARTQPFGADRANPAWSSRNSTNPPGCGAAGPVASTLPGPGWRPASGERRCRGEAAATHVPAPATRTKPSPATIMRLALDENIAGASRSELRQTSRPAAQQRSGRPYGTRRSVGGGSAGELRNRLQLPVDGLRRVLDGADQGQDVAGVPL